MGIEYDLLKPAKKERFELGKGMWSKVFSYYRCLSFGGTISGKDLLISNIYISEEQLYYAIIRHMAWEFDRETKLEYFHKLANNIYNWCGTDIIHFHDQDSFNNLYWKSEYKSYDSYQVEYPYTGSRFNIKEMK